MPSTKDIQLTNFKCLLYGRTGIGKTTLLGTAPKPFIIDVEGGLEPLADHDLQYERVKQLDDFRDLWIRLSKDKEIETVCIDSLSALCDMGLAEIEKELGTEDARSTYPVLRSKIWKLITGYLKLPKHIIMTATETGGDGKPYLPAMMPAKLCEDLARPFDFVQYMAFGKDKVVIHTGRNRDSVSKDRTGEIGATMDYSPGYFEDIIATLFGMPKNEAPQRKAKPDPKKDTRKPKETKPDKLEGQKDEPYDDGLPFDL